MRWLIPLAPLALLGACADELSPDEQARADAAVAERVAAVNAMAPPLEDLAPELITGEDTTVHAMGGAGCRFMPGTNHGLRVVAREADAFIKLGGEVERMAADPGSPALTGTTRTIYTGRAHRMELAVAKGPDGGQEGTITLRDAWNRVTYSGTGEVVCSIAEDL